ncbi:MAG TPA: alpha/beta fold hydrolase [Actinomycetota bacterium]
MADGLLLLHAWPLDARMWEPQLPALDDLTVAAPHHPGFGGSEPAGEVSTMSACAARAVSALDEAGIERAVVCGLSMGGYVAFELWRRAPERFLGLILANTRAVADTPEGAAGRHALAERLRREGNVLVDEPPALLAEDAPAALLEHVRSLIADQTAEAIAASAIGMAERPDSTPDLPGIGVPTLVVTSTGDRLIAPEVSGAMAGAIPGARLEVLEGVGHLTNLEAPEVFGRLLLEHVAACGLA